MTIQHETLKQHCPLDNDRPLPNANQDAFEIVIVPSMGSLDCLPLETMHSILNMLDLQSLTEFRSINRQARTLVDSLWPYSAIVRHSRDVLRALISTRMAVHFTVQHVSQALFSEDCCSCGEFGPFFDLFSGYRCCITCVIYSDRFLCITLSSAKNKFGLSSQLMRRLPTLLSVPGRYTESERFYRGRTSLVRLDSVIAIASGGSQPNPPPMLIQSLRQHDRQGQNPYRFMAMIRIPSIDRDTGALEWGVSCQACRLGSRDETRGYHNWNTVYSATGYLQHFQTCQLSQKGRLVVPKYLSSSTSNPVTSEAKFQGYIRDFRF